MQKGRVIVALFTGITTLCVALTILISSCRSDKKSSVVVAIVSSLTGDLAENGIDIANGARMALEEALADGNLKGREITIKLFDDEADPKVAVSTANRICQDDKIVAVIGPLTSGCASAAAPVYERCHMPVVMPVPTNPEITQKGRQDLFRIPPTDDKQAPFLAEYLLSHDASAAVAVVHDMTTYGEGFARAFQKAFVDGGGKVVAFEGSDASNRDYRTVITRLKSLGPKYILLGATYDMGAPFVRQMRELGLNAAVLAGDGCYGSQFLKLAGSAAEGTTVSFIAPDPSSSDKTAAFFSRYESKYGKVVSFAPLGFDAGLVIAKALSEMRELRREEIVKTLHSPQFELEGVTGRIKFAENGDNLYATLVLYKVENGKWVLLKRPTQ